MKGKGLIFLRILNNSKRKKADDWIQVNENMTSLALTLDYEKNMRSEMENAFSLIALIECALMWKWANLWD